MWLSRPELYYLFYWFLFLYTELTDYEWWSVRIDESNGHRWSWIQVNIFQKISFIINIFQRIYVQLLWWNKEASWLEVIFLVISQKSKPNLNVHQKKAIFWNLDWFLLADMTRNGILLPKLFWPTVRKNCSSDPENLLKFEAEGREFAKFLRSREQFIQTMKGQNKFW